MNEARERLHRWEAAFITAGFITMVFFMVWAVQHP